MTLIATPPPLTGGRVHDGFRPLASVRLTVLVIATCGVGALLAAPLSSTAALGVAGLAAVFVVVNYPAITVVIFALGFGLVWSIPHWPTSPTKAAAILLTAGTVLALIVRGRVPRIHWAHLLFLAFGAWSLVASEAAADATYLRGFATTILGWGFAAIALHQYDAGARGLRLLAGSYVLGVAAGGAIAVDQYLSGAVSVVTPVAGDVNDFGVLTATALFLALGLAREADIPLLARIGWGLCALICLVAVVASFSRGTWTAVGAGLVAHFVFRPRDRRAILVALGGVAALFVVTLPLTLPRLTANASEKAFIASSNVDTRLDAWQLGLRLFVERPLTGWGIGSISPAYTSAFSVPPGALSLAFAHNSYVEVLYGTGIVGAALFVAMMLIALVRSATSPRQFTPGMPGYQVSQVLLPAMVATLVASFTVSELAYAPLWMTFALGMAARKTR